MSEPTLTEVFGANATQDASTVTINKADLAGLTASATNTAESLLAAIMIQAATTLTQTKFDGDTDVSIYIESSFSNFINRGANNDRYQLDPLTVNFAKLNLETGLNPDDY
ncbi:hypothetical protein [Calothrix rhizosoleniae]|uniref:hypothetical protein n=1 Tax=Calothrix rhizosoleniae TaxID=888997 RepID=UPI000B49C211|nr:hypothetical protein [Calothrix rhizosoleniae]